MKFNEDSKHALFYKMFYKKTLPDTLCSYLWNYFYLIIFFPFFGIYKLAAVIFDDEKEYVPFVKILSGICYYALLTLPYHWGKSALLKLEWITQLQIDNFGYLWYPLSVIVGIFGLLLALAAGIAILTVICIIVGTLDWCKGIRSPFKSYKKPSTIGIFINNLRQKYCTKIDWESTKNK